MTEDAEDMTSLAIFKARHAPCKLVRWPEVADFSRGWAIPALRWGPVHYLSIVGDYVATACGFRFPLPYIKGQGLVFFEPGNFRRCKRCEKAKFND